MLEGYQSKEVAAWKRTREIAYMIFCANTKKGGRPSKERFMPLQGDAEATKERANKLKKQYKEAKERYKQLGLI